MERSSPASLRATYQYDAWGNPRSTSGQSFNLFGFTGHERDPETGLYYFKHRFYDPETGRFLTEDPLEGTTDNPPSLQRYLYAYVNPTVYWDPDGRAVGDWWDPRSYADVNWKDVGLKVWNAASLGTLNKVRAQKNLGTLSGLGESTFNAARSISNTASLGLQDSIYETQVKEGPGLKSAAKGLGKGLLALTPAEEVGTLATHWKDLKPEERAQLILTGVSKTAALAAGVKGFVESRAALAESPAADAEASALKQRVLGNLEESRAARDSSHFDEHVERVAVLTGEGAEGGIEAGDTIVREGATAATDTSAVRSEGGAVRTSLRQRYMGSTPDKYSRTGTEVVERMRTEGAVQGNGPLLRGNPNNLQLVGADGSLTTIDASVDMAHKVDAVTWWNEVGRFYGPKSTEVREYAQI